MAQKFGGKYSPNAKNGQQNTATSHQQDPNYSFERTRAGYRLRTLRWLAFPIAIGGVLKFLGGAPFAALITIGCALALMLAFEITSQGLKAEDAYNARSIARRPAWPRKLIGAIITGISLGLLSFVNTDLGLIGTIGSGLFGFAGMVMSYGLDPMKDKGITGENRYQAERAAEAIDRAQSLLDEIKSFARDFRDQSLKNRIDTLSKSAEQMFRAIEEDPEDYRSARRYLSVYLSGARDATAQYLALPAPEQVAATNKYQNLIDELNQGFVKTREELLADKNQSLDIEIDVLRERLALEGINVTKEE